MKSHKILEASHKSTDRTKRTRPRAKNALKTIEKRIVSGKKRFLKELRICSSVLVAAERANLGRRTVYEWRQEDTTFAEAWEDALNLSKADLLVTIHEDCVAGTAAPSERLTLLKHYYPEFRDKPIWENDPNFRKNHLAFAHIMRKYIPRTELKNAFIELCELTGFQPPPAPDGAGIFGGGVEGSPSRRIESGTTGAGTHDGDPANSTAGSGA